MSDLCKNWILLAFIISSIGRPVSQSVRNDSIKFMRHYTKVIPSVCQWYEGKLKLTRLYNVNLITLALWHTQRTKFTNRARVNRSPRIYRAELHVTGTVSYDWGHGSRLSGEVAYDSGIIKCLINYCNFKKECRLINSANRFKRLHQLNERWWKQLLYSLQSKGTPNFICILTTWRWFLYLSQLWKISHLKNFQFLFVVFSLKTPTIILNFSLEHLTDNQRDVGSVPIWKLMDNFFALLSKVQEKLFSFFSI